MAPTPRWRRPVRLSRAAAKHAGKIADPDLSSADLAGARGLRNSLHHTVVGLGARDGFDFHLGQPLHCRQYYSAPRQCSLVWPTIAGASISPVSRSWARSLPQQARPSGPPSPRARHRPSTRRVGQIASHPFSPVASQTIAGRSQVHASDARSGRWRMPSALRSSSVRIGCHMMVQHALERAVTPAAL